MTQWFEVVHAGKGFGKKGYMFETDGPNEFGEYRVLQSAGLGYTQILPEDIKRGFVVPVAGPPGPLYVPADVPQSEVTFEFADEPAKALLPMDSQARKEIPLWTFLSEYFPKTFIALASLSYKANEKHNPGQPMHWSRDKSKDHKNCIARHLMDEERIDPETGEPEAVAAAWRAAANAELVIEKLQREGKYHR